MNTTKPGRYETRQVLAGAYAKIETTLTHLCDSEDKVRIPEGSDGVSMCRRAKNLADGFSLSAEGRSARPTCERCGAIWDKLRAEGALG